MSLAQISISLGKDGEAIKLLLDDPQSVIKAITVTDEAKRPAQGVQSRQFATETYKLLLRAYIGNGKLNEARETMKTLEKVAGAAGGADVTELYVGLGKLLREELDRFREAGETDRFNKLMTSFETFLNDLYQRQEGQTFGSLSWIGETYFALGEAASNDPSRSTASFQKAGDAFEKILTKAEAQPDFMPADQIPAVKVRLVRCYRLKKEFEAGEKLLAEILKAREKDLRAQFEGAYLYQDWAANGNPDDYLKAINGNPAILVWGWRNLGIRLQNAIDQGQESMLPSFVEARLNGTKCRHQYALAQTSIQKRSEELEKAEIELVATVTVSKGLSEEQLAQFNALYRQVLDDSGKGNEYVALKPSPEVVSAPATAVADSGTGNKSKKETKAAEVAPPAPPPASTSTVLIAVGAVVLLGLGIVGWMFMARGKKKPAVVRSQAPVAFSGISAAAPVAEGPPTAIPTATRPKTRPAAPAGAAAAAGTARPKAAAPRPTAGPGTPTGTKPAAPAPGKPATPAARPRPKPPTSPS